MLITQENRVKKYLIQLYYNGHLTIAGEFSLNQDEFAVDFRCHVLVRGNIFGCIVTASIYFRKQVRLFSSLLY